MNNKKPLSVNDTESGFTESEKSYSDVRTWKAGLCSEMKGPS